eukprot:scaffold38769_cov35-Tisochrysis_lutea.AAC.4
MVGVAIRGRDRKSYDAFPGGGRGPGVVQTHPSFEGMMTRLTPPGSIGGTPSPPTIACSKPGVCFAAHNVPYEPARAATLYQSVHTPLEHRAGSSLHSGLGWDGWVCYSPQPRLPTTVPHRRTRLSVEGRVDLAAVPRASGRHHVVDGHTAPGAEGRARAQLGIGPLKPRARCLKVELWGRYCGGGGRCPERRGR